MGFQPFVIAISGFVAANVAVATDLTHPCARDLISAQMPARVEYEWVQFKTPPKLRWKERPIHWFSVNSERAWIATLETWVADFVRYDGLTFTQALRDREAFPIHSRAVEIYVNGFLENSTFFASQLNPQLGGLENRQIYAPIHGVKAPTVLNTQNKIERLDLHLDAWLTDPAPKKNRRAVSIAKLMAFLPMSQLAVFNSELFSWNLRGPRNAQTTDQNRLILRDLNSPGPDGYGANRSFSIAYPFDQQNGELPRVRTVLDGADESTLIVIWDDFSFASYSLASGELLASFQPQGRQRAPLKRGRYDGWYREPTEGGKWVLDTRLVSGEYEKVFTLDPFLFASSEPAYALRLKKRPRRPFVSGFVGQRNLLPIWPTQDMPPLPPGFTYVDGELGRVPIANDVRGNWWVLLPKTRALR